jgi:MFS transporter, DHA1 family, inner membrane transport protein
MKPNFPLLALAVGAFAIGTTEFAPIGLLPVIASDLGVSIPSAGLLVSAYAIGVMLGAPLMTLTTARVPRKQLLIGMMVIFTLGNLLCALAGGYAMLMAARVFTSLAHGAFFGVGSMVAASVVPPDKRAGAVATMFMGLTIANVGGVPLATWVGHNIGWRTAFFGIAALGLFAIAALWFALPSCAAEGLSNVRRELQVLTRPSVLIALLTTVIGAGAMFTFLTYIAAILQHEIAATPGFITGMLVLVGVGFTIGNWLGGRFADRSLTASLIGFLGLLGVVMLSFTLSLRAPVPAAITIFLWAVAAFAIVPPLQTRVMAKAAEAPSLASSVNIGAFNLGNAFGAAIGGGVIALGLGYPWVSIAGAVLAFAGLLVVLVGHRIERVGPEKPELRIPSVQTATLAEREA